MRSTVALFAVSALVGLPLAVCRAQDFSAQVVYQPPPVSKQVASSRLPSPRAAAKLFVSSNKMRLDSAGLNETIMLVDFTAHTSHVLFPGQKTYQQLAAGPPQYFLVTDSDNACLDWQIAAGRDIACEKIGPERVGERDAIKYRSKTAGAEGSAASIWIDPKLKFVVKWADAEGAAELRNIREGAQAAALFVVPPGYAALKPQKRGHWTAKRAK